MVYTFLNVIAVKWNLIIFVESYTIRPFADDSISKDVRLPIQLQRSMAVEAEAARDANAKVIAADGEKNASHAFKEAADIIDVCPTALQLRYLQSLHSISAETNSTIIFPLPVDVLHGFLNKRNI